MANSEGKKKLLKGTLKKAQKCNKAVDAPGTIYFTQPQTHDQRVTVFDSSITSEPFLNSVELENMRNKQQMEEKAGTSHTRS
ncbi:hypothetical protein H2200_009512 [Cladophialophora chaetospira]|uniref:Uncharacterized protein n=1 Tax=Cladophialophora chaetospira TaxID=386627 RepID=A0AA39CET4_9EURO|nr:hypothetical protein H2200_009512 [Cladophialophora chaetospira]